MGTVSWASGGGPLASRTQYTDPAVNTQVSPSTRGRADVLPSESLAQLASIPVGANYF